MKQLSVAIAFCFLAATASAGNDTEQGFAKREPVSGNGISGKFMLTCGAGFNFMGAALRLQYNSSSYWSDRYTYRNINGNAPPMLNIAVDYGFSPRFSAGLSFGCQTVRLAVQDTNTATGEAGLIYTDIWQRFHFAARGDYYMVARDKFSLYTGLKIGYNRYSMTSTRDVIYPTYTQELNVNPSPVSVQAHIGMSYFWRSMIGFNAELGLGVGGPYVFALGAAVKI